MASARSRLVLATKTGPLIEMPEILYCFGAATNQNDRLRKNEMKEVFFFYSQNVANSCIGRPGCLAALVNGGQT